MKHSETYYNVRRVVRVLFIAVVVVLGVITYKYLMGFQVAPQPYRGVVFMLIIADFVMVISVSCMVLKALFLQK